MSTVNSQIERGLIVGPISKRHLRRSADGQWLEDEGSQERYRIIRNVLPVLLADEKWAAQYAGDSTQMQRDYTPGALSNRWHKYLTPKAYPTDASRRAFLRIFEGLGDDAVCLSPGGGPSREHPRLTTLNIGPFPNVDVVADAHALPYADGSVDALYCEAVYEHLYDPAQAAREAFRILKSGRLAYVCTPFLQPYHGYPHHYQNFTITGHARLFEQAGFEIVESGTAVGPVFALVTMVGLFLSEYVPNVFGKVLRGLWGLASTALSPLDKWIAPRQNAHLLASTTYVLLRKPL